MKAKSITSITVNYLAMALVSLAVTPVWAGTFASPFTAGNVTLNPGNTFGGNSASAAIVGGDLVLNPETQGTGGDAQLSDLDPGQTVQSFTLSATVTTANSGAGTGADGFGVYFAAPGVVLVDSPANGEGQSYEDLAVGNGIALLFNDFAGTISIETGSTLFSTTVPKLAMVGNSMTIDFSYDPVNGAVLDFTAGNANLYTVDVSEATLVADGLSLQSGDTFIMGGRVGYPGASSADSHTFDSLTINTTDVPEPSTIASLIMGLGCLILFRFRKQPRLSNKCL